MPQDRPLDAERSEARPAEPRLSLVSLAREQANARTEIDLFATAAGTGLGKMLVAGAGDALTRHTLAAPIIQRSGVGEWWQKASSTKTQSVFLQERASIVECTRAVDFAEQVRDAVAAGHNAQRAPLTEFGRVFKQASDAAGVLRAQSDSFTRIASARDAATAVREIDRTLMDFGTSLGADDLKGLRNYKQLIAEGQFTGELAAAYRMEVCFTATDLERKAVALAGSSVDGLKKQYVFLESLVPHAETIVSELGTEREVRAGTKLFAREWPVGRALESYADYAVRLKNANAEIKAAQLNLETQLASGGEQLMPRGGHGARLIRGVGLSTLSMATGYGVDLAIGKVFGIAGLEQRNNGARFAVDGCLVPALIMSDLPARFKLPVAVAAFAASRANNFVSTTDFLSPNIAKVLKPNQADTYLLGAAVMAPLVGRYRAAAIASAVGIGRLVNYVAPEEKREQKSL